MNARAWVREAKTPMALFAPDGTCHTSSEAWSALLGTSWTASHHETLNVLLSTPGFSETVRQGARWIALQATAGPDDGSVLVMATDVTDIHAEAVDLRDRVSFMELQALSLSTFAKVLGTVDLVLFAMDPSGVTTMSDGKGLDLLGLRPGERVGQNELTATLGTPTHEYLKRALAGETLHVLVEPKQGVHFDTWYLPLLDENNRPDGVLGLSIDATERVSSEERLAHNLEVIHEQSETIRALAASVLKVWDEVLCMPVVGAVDEARASGMMERLLDAIVREKARFAILDLTGVEMMDTATMHNMVRILAAARALGAFGVLCGVQPAVAHSMVALGVDTGPLRMVRTLHDALAWCLETRGRGAAARR